MRVCVCVCVCVSLPHLHSPPPVSSHSPSPSEKPEGQVCAGDVLWLGGCTCVCVCVCVCLYGVRVRGAFVTSAPTPTLTHSLTYSLTHSPLPLHRHPHLQKSPRDEFVEVVYYGLLPDGDRAEFKDRHSSVKVKAIAAGRPLTLPLALTLTCYPNPLP